MDHSDNQIFNDFDFSLDIDNTHDYRHSYLFGFHQEAEQPYMLA